MPRVPALLGCLLVLALACGEEASEAEGEGEAADSAAASEPSGSPPASGTSPPSGPAASAGLERFHHWSPLHAFVHTPVIAAEVIGEREAIVATKDSLVAVTGDGGQTWTWTRAPQPVVGVAGYAGGPYVLLHPTSLSLSSDGRVWQPHPRWANDVFIDVLAEIGRASCRERVSSPV